MLFHSAACCTRSEGWSPVLVTRVVLWTRKNRRTPGFHTSWEKSDAPGFRLILEEGPAQITLVIALKLGSTGWLRA